MTKYRRPQRVTLKTLSERLGVSPATISKALRESTDISDEMKRKVRALTQELGYHPNLMARSLVKRRSNIIGVMVSDLNISHYSYLVQYIYEHAQNHGYESIVMFHHEDPEKEKKNLQFLLSLQVDGMLVSVTNGNKNRELLKRIHEQGTPVVCYDRRTHSSDFSLVMADDCKETEALMKSFLKSGRKKIGFVGITQGDDTIVPRYESYIDLLKRMGLEYEPNRIIESKPNIEDAYRQTNMALANGLDIDAVLCAGGFFAYGAGKAILEKGLHMPEDILLGEYGNNNIVQRLGISYYSTDHSPEFIAEKAVDLLDDYLKDTNREWNPQSIKVSSKLIYHDHTRHEEQIIKVIE